MRSEDALGKADQETYVLREDAQSSLFVEGSRYVLEYRGRNATTLPLFEAYGGSGYIELYRRLLELSEIGGIESRIEDRSGDARTVLKNRNERLGGQASIP